MCAKSKKPSSKKKKKDSTVRVRVAPSPTGDPHVGTAYIALFNRTFAHSQGGTFVLRIEDTDQKRSRSEYEDQIIESLQWLGLTWEEGPDVGGPYGPYRQSERTELYKEHADKLIESGHAYRCFCTPEELTKLREESRAAGRSVIRSPWREADKKDIQAKLDDDATFTVRLKVPDKGATTFSDMLRDEITWQNGEVDDQVLLKSDGFPTYHLANVVDDHLMEITHVIRAEEWISSTPKHVLLYEAFGWDPPVFCHMPLLRNKDTSKISKRKNPCSLHYYKKKGVLPHALVNFLGLQGYSMPDEREKFTLEEFTQEFEISRVKTRGPVFDLEKLLHLNGLYLRDMEPADLVKLTAAHLETWIANTIDIAQDRMNCLSDFVPVTSFLFEDEFHGDWERVIGKKAPLNPVVKLLKDFRKILAECPWTIEGLQDAVNDYADKTPLNKGGIFKSLRVAVTGKLNTPPLMESIVSLERFNVLERLRHAIDQLNHKTAKAKFADYLDFAKKDEKNDGNKGGKKSKKGSKDKGKNRKKQKQ